MLLHRVLTAIVLLALVSLALFFTSGLTFKIIALVLPIAASWEWANLFGYSARQKTAYVAVSALLGVLAVLLPTGHWSWGLVFGLASLFWLAIAPAWLFLHWRLAQAASALLGWILLYAAWQGLIVWHDKGPQALIALMLVVWIADTAAYFVGKAFGKHKLAPSVSPGKTWEGAVGAFVAVAIYLNILMFTLKPETIGLGQILLIALTALLLTAVSIVGDLLESLFKRQAGLKDSGKLLPGHGGILDRVDSLIAVLALAGAARWVVSS